MKKVVVLVRKVEMSSSGWKRYRLRLEKQFVGTDEKRNVAQYFQSALKF